METVKTQTDKPNCSNQREIAMTTQLETSASPFGEVIFSYTRAQAIADGVLVDLSAVAPDVCRQHFKYPIACTASVWAIIEKAIAPRRQAGGEMHHMNDLNGVVHDMLWMSKAYSRELDPTTRLFKVIITGAGKKRNFTFKIVCGPGDDAEPVLTIMLPEED